MILERFSLGIGDRFGREGVAQLRALQQAAKAGVDVSPVWNKSYREHSIIGTNPVDTRSAADKAVKDCAWNKPYYVDADHISLSTVDRFTAVSDFFTIDVADFIGKSAETNSVESFVRSLSNYRGTLRIPGFANPINVSEEDVLSVTKKYLLAVQEAGKLYRHIVATKGSENFVTEISIDEAAESQSPKELFFILAAIAWEHIPIQTIAPKFTGKFLKGIDYVGSTEQFSHEFENDLHVIAHAIKVFDLPKNLKLSVHSGSDKFSLYPSIHRIICKQNAGLHLKTAGTTWLEELIGMALAGGKAYAIAQGIYSNAYRRVDELCKPYESVIEIDYRQLPHPDTVNTWNKEEFVAALRHDQTNPSYNVNFRQLLHLAYKVAAEMGEEYIHMLDRSREYIARNVTENLFLRHITPLFLGQ